MKPAPQASWPDATAASLPEPAASAARGAGASLRLRIDRLSLQWRVFAVNAVIFVLATATLAWAPVTVHRVATRSELVVLALGLILMLVLDLILLRRAFGPLQRLATAMRLVDPTQPSDRLASFEDGSVEVRSLAAALNRMLERLERERRESALRELAAQERERARIAGELHDEVGQMLTAIALRAERAAAQPVEQQREALLAISQSALGSLEDVRRIGRELRPEALDDLGLVNAVIALCRRVDGQPGLSVRRALDWGLPVLDPEVELVIYRVAQEALTNALRHSGGDEVVVQLRHERSSVILEVADNGRGLPPQPAQRGMRGMRERAAVVGGTLEISAGLSGGTRVTLSVPA